MLVEPTLTTPRPELGEGDAEALARDIYGLELTASALTSERDRNFRMLGADGSGFVLKVSNPAEEREVVNLQTCALAHLGRADPGLAVPRPVATLQGEYETTITLGDGRTSILRMLTYLPGLPLSQSPRTSTQRRALGQTLARMDLAFAGFDHPAADHELLWNVAAAHRLKGMIAYIEDASRRALIERGMAEYERNALPRIPALRSQVIHNDYNLGNVLVDPDRPDEVAAIIDFGDVVRGPLVGELATAAAYQLTDAADPLASAAEMIAGYHGVIPLLEEERAILLDLVKARLLITVLITGWRAERYPENRDYILRNNGPAWAGLEHLDRFAHADASAQLLQFCSSGDEP
ncbi:phosphotransferase [Novosphingobium aquimarinum]|uniref:phosphotransferase n=1 Tax=Novosphingobium aquimarinum TaxID=2682494 RepID=UPI0018DC2F0A|nr:phosphotransferase [Novosphingobium aquimarinum]